MNLSIDFIPFQQIHFDENIGNGPNSTTYCSTLENYSTKCVARIINNSGDVDKEKIISYVQKLKEINHEGIIPFIGLCSADDIDNTYHRNILFYKYASNSSIQHILNSQKDDANKLDLTTKIIIIYGIAQTLHFLHANNIFHGRLTSSNILINDHFEPQISDIHFSLPLSNYDTSIKFLKKYNLYYYVDPSTLKNGEVNFQSDVYAFAIISLQIFSDNNQIYGEEENNIEKLIYKIKTENLLPIFPIQMPQEIKKLLIDCLNKDPALRPQFKDICQQLDLIIPSLSKIQKNVFNKYKQKILSQNFNLKGTNNTPNLQQQNDIIDDDIISINEDNANGQIPNNKKDDNFINLIDDNYYDKPKIDFGKIISNIENNLNNKIEEITFERQREIDELNFVQTEGAKERLFKIASYIQVNVPVLLEGPTGTSKTLSSEIVCIALGKKLVRFNLSSETKTQDLIGRYVGDDSSWAGISMKDGSFLEAFATGKVLLLDEINLAPPSVLQCIEEALDNGVMSIEIPGRPLEEIKMHKDFRLIATQNPNKGLFANKRQNLGLKFYSRFQTISFPALTIEELQEIALNLAKKFNYNNETVVKELVAFHKEWSDYREKADDTQCFTIREIAATIYALANSNPENRSVFDTIMTNYGDRYEREMKKELINTLNRYPNLINDSKDTPIPTFPGCFMNKSLKSAIKSILFSFKNHRNVLLTGKTGCGKTQLAIWVSEYYNNNLLKSNSNDETQNETSFFCVCTEEIKVADLVGRPTPSGNTDGTSKLIIWQDGFMTKAIRQGKCCVLESLDEAPATVTERLNELLDEKYDNKDRFFYIAESSSCSKVLINNNFRILATCNIEKLSNMSPALLNRFDIIVLDDQIEDNISDSEFQNLLQILLQRYCSNLPLKTMINDIKQNNDEEKNKNLNDLLFSRIRVIGNEEEDNDYENDYENNDNESDNDESDDDNNNNEDNDENDDDDDSDDDKQESIDDYREATFSFSENIKSILYEKLKKEKNISYISKICKAIIKLSFNLQHNKDIKDNEIVDLVFLLFDAKQNSSIPIIIEEELLGMLQNIKKNNDSPFFYSNSSSLKTFLAKLMAYSIIEQPVCITGPTGIGKTSASRAFSMMRPHKSSNQFGFQFHSFHSGTKASHFFGTTTLYDGQIKFHDGTLTTALKEGLVFIADEFNLSPQSVMKTLSLALDPSIGQNVFIPGTGQIINISSGFFFIACQNELGTIGRNAIPDPIAQRLIEIDYPRPEDKDIEKICIEIAKDNSLSDTKLAKCIGSYMTRLNDLKLNNVPQWSLRDITKLFRRIYKTKDDSNYINITPYHHILFYTLSAVPPNESKIIINTIKTQIKISFNIDDIILEELIGCFVAVPKIDEIENKGYFLMKGNSGISISKVGEKLIDKTLPSLWNTIFQVLLADEKEPILLMGKSGYKTFLAHELMPSAQIISLNQETTVAQLLGTSSFMTTSEAKHFYIEYICKILRINKKAIELKNKWENNKESIQKEINDLIQEGKRSAVPDSLNYALDHLYQKLFDKSNENKRESFLSDTVLEFRPGLFLDAIIQRQSLILKDLSNLQTIVLERFNELFSGKQNITLFEDIHDTFTSKKSKELTDFNVTLRVIATCPEDSPTKLSEAVLSRFSVIAVSEYEPDEQGIVLKSYIQNSLFDQDDIKKIKKFTKKYDKTFSKSISFPQKIKIVELASRINKVTCNDNKEANDIQRQNLGLTLYRYLGGLMESIDNKNKLINLIKESFDLPNIYQLQLNETPNDMGKCQLEIYNQDDQKGVLSNMSNLFLRMPNARTAKTVVTFTPSFNDLIDLIHLGLTIHNSIILEGPPGQGKHTAINYIAEMLDIEVIQITISKSTKVEDLFGKETITRKDDRIIVDMIETEFVHNIKTGDNLKKKSLIILENINNASPAVLNALAPVFNSDSKKIYLPNGKIITKGQFDMIGILNTQQASSSKDKLPSSLINSSIYHIVSKPNPKEIYGIILTKFQQENFELDEAIRFNDAFMQAKNSADTELFTLNDIQKYILFRSLTKECFDEKTILQMIFVYRFSTDNMIQSMRKLLKLEEMKFNPIFSYNVPPTDLFIQIRHSSDNKEPINSSKFLTVPSNPEDSSILSEIDTLTLPQKHCLVFLVCSLLSKRTCVVQGDTASGKSYIIRLFSRLLGKKLIVYQMNTDSNISMFVGQSILNSKLSKDDLQKMKKAINDLCVCEQIKDFINAPCNNIKVNGKIKCEPIPIKKLLNFIKDIEHKIKDEIYWPDIQYSINIIKETINPLNRFQIQPSEFINAMLNGYWILIDGIESAPSLIAEKIASLCGENPELNLYEFGSKMLYSANSTDPKYKIHKDFHLFITYNPYSLKEYQISDQSFLIKSVTFTLPQIDENIQNSAQILFGSLVNQCYPSDLSKELAPRLSSMHAFAKLESQKNPDNYVSDFPYHGRILAFETKVFNLFKKEATESNYNNISKSICFLIKLFYGNSCINKEIENNFCIDCLKEFQKEPSASLTSSLQTSGMNVRERNEPALISLRNIQKNVIQKANLPYSFSELMNNLYLIRVSDIFYVQKHLKSTIQMVKSNAKKDDDLNTNPMIKYGSLLIFSSIFKQILKPEESIQKEHTFLPLKDKELRNDKAISSPLSKFDLLYSLLQNNYFSENSSILLKNDKYSDLISLVSTIISNKQKNSIKNLFDKIKKSKSNIDFIDKIFPYAFFKDSNLYLIKFWLPLTKILIREKIHFSIVIDKNKFELNSKSKINFTVNLKMNEKDNLSLSKGSNITFTDKSKSVYDIPANEDVLIYHVINELAISKEKKKSKHKTLGEILADPFEKAKSIIAEKGELSQVDDQILSIKDLFDSNNEKEDDSDDNNENDDDNNYEKDNKSNNISLISMIWNLAFTLNNSEIQNLSSIINPIEKKLLLAITKMHKKVKPKSINKIISWCKWAERLEEYTIVLKSILKPNYAEENPNIDSLISIIQNEMTYLQNSPDKKNKFWDSKDLIEIYEKEHNRLNDLKAQKDLEIETLAIKNDITKLKNDLLKDERIKKENYLMRDEIVELIKSITEFTTDKYTFVYNIVQQFINDASSSNRNKEKTYINWPPFEECNSKSIPKTTNIKLFESLIRYSRINSLLNDIKDGKDIMLNLRKLNDFTEMNCSRILLLSNLIKSSKKTIPEITSNDINNARYTLEANMIMKFYTIDRALIIKPEVLYDKINYYSKRNLFNKKADIQSEIYWIYQAMNEYSPNFVITIPTFSPNSLVFLIVNKNADNSFQAGPLLKEVKELESEFLLKQSNIMYSHFDDFCHASKDIALITYQHLYSSNENEQQANQVMTYKEIKKKINDYKASTKKESDIIKSVKFIFMIAESFDKMKKQKEQKVLLFNDIFFLSQNWNELFKNKTLLNEYPSLLFWISKNDYCAKQLMKMYKDYNYKPNEIPLWLIYLRITSSKECIRLTSSHNTISNTINDAITDKVLSYLSSSGNKELNYNWLNLMVSNLPQDITNNDIRIIHDFLMLLSLDNQEHYSKIILELKNEFIKNSISEITDSVLNNNYNDLLSYKISQDNQIIQFLCYPSIYIRKKIDDNIIDISKAIIANPSIIAIKNLISSKKLKTIIKTLDDAINKENEDYKTKYEETIIKEYNEQREKKIKNLKKNIKKYNKYIHFYKECDVKSKNTNKVVEDLQSLEEKLNNYPELFKKEQFKITYVEYRDTICIVSKKGKETSDFKLENKHEETSKYYLLPNENVAKKSKKKSGVKLSDIYFKYIYEKYSNDPSEIEKLIKVDNDIVSSIPVLLFSHNSMLSKDFIKIVEELDKSLNDLYYHFIFIIEECVKNPKSIQNMIDFNIFKSISNLIKKVGDNLQVEFSNGDESTKTKNVCQGELKDFLELLSRLVTDSNAKAQDFCPVWNVLNSKQQIGKIFQFDYDIIDIKENKLNQIYPNFSILDKIDSLASPIFSRSIDDNKICSVDKLKCIIGPIFPALYSNRPVSINLISFIKEDVSVTIDYLSNPQFSQLLSIKKNLTNSEPIQIFIKLPNATKTNDDLITIDGKLKLDIAGDKPYIFPFEINLYVLPLKIRLRSLQFPLSEIKKNYFRLCCSFIDSGDTIDFELINFYKHDQFILDTGLEALDENQADQPIKRHDPKKRYISLTIPQVLKPTRCQFDTIFKLAQNFECRVLCDFIIRPLIFTFEVYDYCTKEFTSDVCQIFMKSRITQKLYFRVFCLYPIKMKANISYSLPYSISVKDPQFDINSFDIKDGFTFTLELYNSNSDSQYNNISYLNKYNNYEINLKIGNTQKTIKFYFIDTKSMQFYPNTLKGYENVNNNFLYKFPCYSYQCLGQKWIKIRNENEMQSIKNPSHPYVIVTPFAYYTNQTSYTEINYASKEYVTTTLPQKYPVRYMKITTENDFIDTIRFSDTAHKETIIIENTFLYIFEIKKDITYFSIIGYIENDYDNWFPAFSKYPYIQNMNALPYSDDRANIIAAHNNIDTMLKYLNADLKSIISCFSSNKQLPIRQTNIAILIAMLLDLRIVREINKIIECFPNSLRTKFDDILHEIEPFFMNGVRITHNLYTIISHNLIIKFIQVFNFRFNEIFYHKMCLQFPLTESQIMSQIQYSFNEFMQFDMNKKYVKNYNITSEFAEKEKELLDFPYNNITDESDKFECVLISENDEPQPCHISDNLGTISNYEYNDDVSIISDAAHTITSLPCIDIPIDRSIKSLSIFFSSCAQGATVLPTYIRSCIKNSKALNEPEEYFSKLFNIYNEVIQFSTSNKSILSSAINSFIESFKNCVKRLTRAGANFDKIKLPQSIYNNNNYYSEFIWVPEIDQPNLSHILWKTKDQIINSNKKYTNDIYIDPGKLHMEESTKLPDINQNGGSQTMEKHDQDPNAKIKIDSRMKFSNEDKNLRLSKFHINNPDDNYTNSNNNIKDSNESKKDDDIDKNIDYGFHIEPDSSKLESTDVSTENFDIISENIKEIDNIQFIMNRISKMNKNDQLELSDVMNNANYTIYNQDQLFETDDKDFSVKYLVDNTQYLITKLIEGVSNSDCPFLLMSCNLLIDCSKLIDNDLKLFNFMILTAFSYSLSALEIPFTISVIADQNFRFLLKPYEEDISMKVLQRVLDCLFIKRYRANIADTFHYAIELLKHKERSQRAIFIFTNGLDENLKLIESWKKLILNDPNNSFGLIFVKPKLLEDIQYKTILDMWNEFNNEVQTSAISKTRLISVNQKISMTILQQIIQVFVDVLSHPIDPNNKKDSELDPKPEFVEKCKELDEDAYINIKRSTNYDFGKLHTKIFRKINQFYKIPGSRFEKLDVRYYRNKTAKMALTTVDQAIKNDFDHFIYMNFYSKRNLYRAQHEVIFKPNKASQTVLSSTGTDFDITALILNLINPVPNPLIYLEEKGGLIRNYGVSIIIDSSISCFNQFSSLHSYQTLKVLLSGLESIDIPCADVLIATDDAPIILSTEIPSKRLFSQKSSFWPSLFSTLANNCSISCKLESAIHAAYDIRRMRSVNSTSYMFILTDGLYQKDQKELIKKHVATCAQSGITIFGIGIGPYPIGIKDIFPNAVFSPNPNFIFQGIASFFGDESGTLFDDSIKVILPKNMKKNEINDTFDKLKNCEKNPIFEPLKNYLSKVVVGIDAVSHVYNKEINSSEGSFNLMINPQNTGFEMYVKNTFEGQKILVVMPYDASMNMQENPKLLPENLFKSDSDETCVQEAVEHYGIKIEYVQNYYDAINKLTQQTELGKCDYYAVWILSGLPYDVPLADGGNQNLVLQFIHCVIQFWEKGGSVVLFAEGDPLTFQANLFLQEVTFPGNVKTKLQLSGIHCGKKILKPDPTGKLIESGKFNKHPNEYDKFHRAPLGHNLFQIYEGETISFVEDDKSLYDPFVPFMRDTEGGISALFYPGDRDQNNKRGDIIIDCGYSKLFDAMTQEGTFKYIQNISAWTAQYESRQLSMDNPAKFRPNAIIFELNESDKFDGFTPIPKEFEVNSKSINSSQLNKRLFAIDHSASVNKKKLYHNELKTIFENYYKEGDVILIWGEKYDIIDKNRMDEIIKKQEGTESHTRPYKIAEALEKDLSIPREHLILVTDGCVDSGSIEKSDNILTDNDIHFKYVTTYVIGNDGDLSVGAPFARGCGSITIEIKSNSRKEIIGAKSTDFSSLKRIGQINNINSFNNLFDSLFNATKQKMIGTKGDQELLNQFEMMNQRIIQSGETTSDYTRKIKALKRMAEGAIQNVFDSKKIIAFDF